MNTLCAPQAFSFPLSTDDLSHTEHPEQHRHFVLFSVGAGALPTTYVMSECAHLFLCTFCHVHYTHAGSLEALFFFSNFRDSL